MSPVVLTYAIIHSLINGRSDPTPFLAHNDNLRNLKRSKIAQSELHKLSIFMHLIKCLQSLFKMYRAIWSMQVEDVHTISPQLFQGKRKLLFEDRGFVSPRLCRKAFGSYGQASLVPVCFC